MKNLDDTYNPLERLSTAGSILMALALIAIFIALVLTVVAVVAHKQGLTQSLKMEPKAFFVGLWCAVAVVSTPGLIAWGSVLVPPPAVSTATRVDPAYLESKGDIQKESGASQERLKELIGESAYEEHKEDLTKGSYARPSVFYLPVSAEDSKTPDSCTALRIQYWRAADRHSGFDTMDVAPASYDAASCGELKPYPNS